MADREDFGAETADRIAPLSSQPAGDGEVGQPALTDLVALVRTHGIVSMDELLADTGASLASLDDPASTISWETFRRLSQNAARDLSDADVIALGHAFLRLDSARPLIDMALFLKDPMECYRLITGPGRLHLIPCIKQLFTQVDHNHLRIELRMQNGYEPSPAYFLVRQGALEAVPTIHGYPKARVKRFATDRGVCFEIEIRRPTGLLAAFRRWSQKLRGDVIPRERVVEVMKNLGEKFDVTRLRMESLDEKLEQLKITEELFTHSFRAAPVSMFINRASDLKIIDVNDRFLASTGYTREEALSWTPPGQTIWADPKERDAIYAAIQKPGGSVDSMEVRLRHRDGHDTVVLVSVKKVDLAGEPCILWQAVDISDRKRAEQELATYRDQLEHLVSERTQDLENSLESLRRAERLASIGTLAAGVAHQINNPVGAIRAASQFALICEDSPDAVSQYREALETCVQQADRCGQIVRNILQFSRGEEGERSQEDLRLLVSRSCKLVSNYAQEREVRIEAVEQEEEVMVFVNSLEIEQVLVNVLRNAIEAGDKGSPIQVRTQSSDTEALVDICDEGPGIPAEHAPYLFDPFYTTRLHHGGTGLGLSVAHGIVTAHGGSINANIETKNGTTIQIRLPLERPSKADGSSGPL